MGLSHDKEEVAGDRASSWEAGYEVHVTFCWAWLPGIRPEDPAGSIGCLLSAGSWQATVAEGSLHTLCNPKHHTERLWCRPSAAFTTVPFYRGENRGSGRESDQTKVTQPVYDSSRHMLISLQYTME